MFTLSELRKMLEIIDSWYSANSGYISDKELIEVDRIANKIKMLIERKKDK